MAWTDDQLLAINTHNSNIIVSAGAGSGKTAVLTERITKIVETGISVKNLVVLTFTKAAALEMKTRIYDSLIKKRLDYEASLVHSSDITTFDAYSLKLVKKYYYLLGVDKSVSVSDEAVIESELINIIKNIFNRFYETNDERFFNLIKHQGYKDDTMLIDAFVKLHKDLSLLLDTNKYLEEYEVNYLSDDFFHKVAKDFEGLVLNDLALVIDMYNQYYEYILDEDVKEKAIEDARSFTQRLEDIESFNDFAKFKYDNGVGRTKVSEEARVLKNKAKAEFDKVKQYVSEYKTLDDVIIQLKNCKEDIKLIVEIAKEIEKEINKFKHKYQAFTFNDIAKMAIDLVSNYDEVKDYFKSKYEILVDEYQDTSDLQEAFLKEISNNNLYMVGDIKQSIYRFRNANPFIFKNKYDDYRALKGGIKIDLLKNFRSRGEVLDNINLLFSQIMTDECGDANYIEEHQMNYGLDNYDNEEDGNDYNLESYVYEVDEKNNNDNIDHESDEEEFIEDEKVFNNLDKFEIEGFIIADIIKDILKRKTYDKKTNKLRDTKFSDIAIIIAAKNNFNLYREILEYHHIPLEIVGDIPINSSIFTHTMINLLVSYSKYINKIYDTEYKIALTGLYRSFIFEYSEETIYKILNKEIEDDLLIKFRNLDSNLSPKDTFLELLDNLGVYEKLSKIGSIDKSLVELNYLFDALDSYNDLGYDLYNCALALKDKIYKDIDIKINPDKPDVDAVKIMSIHKSKGLEFPYCIFPEMTKKFNSNDSKSTFSFSNKYGIFIRSFLETKWFNTVIYKLNKKLYKLEDLSERIRVLYVALTRAREKMYFIRQYKDKEINSILNCNSFNDLLIYSNKMPLFDKVVNLNKLNLSDQYKVKVNLKIESKNVNLIYDDFDFSSNALYKKNISSNVDKILTKTEKDNLAYGTKIHEILETLDFTNLNLDYLDNKDKTKINNLLKLDIFKNIDKAECYQEHEFHFIDKSESYHGIIDLLIEHKDVFYIIDYKLYDIDNPHYIDQLKVYYNYLKSHTNKEIRVFLLSIVKEEYKELKY